MWPCSEATESTKLDVVWARAVMLGLDRFIQRVAKETGAGAGYDNDDDSDDGESVDAVGAVRRVLYEERTSLCATFDFFASFSGYFDGTLSLNPYTQVSATTITSPRALTHACAHCSRLDALLSP